MKRPRVEPTARAKTTDRAARWTPSQERAIAVRGKDVLVSAAAGSGKTSVLVERILRRLLDPDDPVDVDRLLVVTFTEAAASEMRERLHLALSQAADAGNPRAKGQLLLLGKASISTLHSFCLQLVRRHAYLVDIDPRFRVLDPEEAGLLKVEAMDELFESLHQDPEEYAPLLEHYAGKRDDRELRALVLALFEYVESLPDPEAWLDRAARSYDPREPESASAFQRWREALLAEARAEVERALFSLARAIDIARLPAGPEEYLESFQTTLGSLQHARDLLAQGGWDEAALALASVDFPRLPARGGSDPVLREEARKARDAAKEIVNDLNKGLFGRSLASYHEDLSRLEPVVTGLCRLVRAYGQRYQRRKDEAGGVDFADLERLALKALTHSSGRALAECRRRFVEVLVDEYQDINPVQDRLITLVSRREEGAGNRFLVGDVKQSIYRFRLADPRIFQEKHRTFADPADPLSVRIDLQANFRSRPEILEAVNFLFRQIMYPETAEIDYDEAAELRPGREEPGEPLEPACVEVHLIERLREKEPGAGEGDLETASLAAVEREAAVVGRLIRRLVHEGVDGRDGRYSYRDIAVLMRSPKGKVNRLIEVLEAMGIPAHSSAGSGFFTAVEVQVVMALLRLLDNPLQDIPLAAVLRSPIVGLDERDLAEIRARQPRGPFHAAVRAFAENESELASRVRAFLAQLDAWRTKARRMPLSRLLSLIYDETRYLDFVAALPRGRQREANLLALWRRARQFDAFATSGLDRFIRHVDGLAEAGEDAAPPPALGEGEDVVRVMSVHQSKGLEFPVVFVIDLDRSFNLADSQRHLIFHRELGLGARVVDRERKVSYPSLAHRAVRARLDGESLAEEMRLLYVALTRAKEKLILVSTARDLEARAAQAAEAARHRGWRLPASTVLKARSWLDWLLPAIARHRDGQPLRAHGAGDLGEAFYAPADPEVFEAQARWSVHLWTQDTVDAIDIAPRGDTKDLLPWEAMARRTPVTMEVDPQLREKLDQIVAADYPHAGLLETPAKVSVTETARRFEAGEDEVEELLYRRPSLLRPSLGARRQPLSAAERGTAVHTFLARLDFGDVSLGGLRAQAERLCQRGILSQAELEAIDFSSLARFFATPLGERIVRASQDNGAASRFWRELAFTMRLPARAFWDQEIRDPGEPGHDVVVVQGAIDCLVREDDRFLLIDYKTDRVEPGREAEAAKRYHWQVRLYREFVSRSAPGAHVEPYLVFLETGQAVKME